MTDSTWLADILIRVFDKAIALFDDLTISDAEKRTVEFARQKLYGKLQTCVPMGKKKELEEFIVECDFAIKEIQSGLQKYTGVSDHQLVRCKDGIFREPEDKDETFKRFLDEENEFNRRRNLAKANKRSSK